MEKDDAHRRFLKHFLQNRDAIYAFILVLMRDRARAEDVFQDASLTLWEKFDTFREGTSFGAWARQVAYFKIRNERRREMRGPLALCPEAVDAVANAFARSEEAASDDTWRETLRRCLDRLSQPARRLVDMRYTERLGLEEIAQRLGRTAAGVNSGLCKIRVALEACVRQSVAGGRS